MSNERTPSSSSRNSTNSTTNSRSDTIDSRSVDSILKDFGKSFALFKSTTTQSGIFNSWKPESWSLSSAKTTEWIPSLDASNCNWRDFGLLKTASSSSTSASSGSGTIRERTGDCKWDDLTKRLPTLSLAESQMIQSFSQQMERKINDMVNQITSGVFLGAVLGSAVTAGIVLGLGLVGASTTYMPVLFRWVLYQKEKRSNNNGSSTLQQPKMPNDSDTSPATSSIVTDGNIVIIQGKAKQLPSKDAVTHCESCLQNVASTLIDHHLTWQDVKRVTAYIVSGACDGLSFRKALQQFTAANETVTTNGHLRISSSGNQPMTSSSTPLVSILFVQQLEEPSDIMEVEVLATKG